MRVLERICDVSDTDFAEIVEYLPRVRNERERLAGERNMAYSRYYRYRLSELQRKLYDELLLGMEERKQKIHSGNYSVQDMQTVLYAINFDNPSLYYVDFGKIKIMQSAFFSIFVITYYCDADTQRTIDKKIKAVTDLLRKQVIGLSMQSAALMLHDWLVSRCSYGECDTFPNAAHSIVGALLYSKCVCEGYAKAYKYLADLVKIRCLVVTGKGIHPDGTENGHAWNIIKMNDHFYHVDVTFDLLIANRYCSRAYFLLSTKEILHDHSMDESVELPVCTSNGSILKKVSGTEELLRFLENEYRKRVTHSEVRLTKGFTKEKLMSMISKKLSAKDAAWAHQIASYWYGDYCRTLFVCWR